MKILRRLHHYIAFSDDMTKLRAQYKNGNDYVLKFVQFILSCSHYQKYISEESMSKNTIYFLSIPMDEGFDLEEYISAITQLSVFEKTGTGSFIFKPWAKWWFFDCFPAPDSFFLKSDGEFPRMDIIQNMFDSIVK